MIRRHNSLIGILLCLGLCGCTDQESDTVYKEDLIAFGTLVSVSIHGVDEGRARTAIREVDAMFQRQHRDWHAWQKGQLTELNASISAGKPMRVDPSILELIRLGQRYERSSRGLFNPAIGNLLSIWGFQQNGAPTGPPPEDSLIKLWRQSNPSSLDLDISGQTVTSRNSAVSLDFGAFAKGYAVGKSIELLKKHRINNMLVNAGGDLCVHGKHGDRPWQIGIRHPDGLGILGSIQLDGATCAFTSGNYERYFEYDGRRYHHILDPGTGYPATGILSATVLASDPTLADAAATALFVAGPKRWQEIAANMGLQDVLLIDDGGTALVSTDLSKRIQFEQQPKHVAIVRIGDR